MVKLTYSELQKRLKPYKDKLSEGITLRSNFKSLSSEWKHLTGEEVEQIESEKPTSGNKTVFEDRPEASKEALKQNAYSRLDDLADDPTPMGSNVFSLRLPQDVEKFFMSPEGKKDTAKLRAIIVEAVRNPKKQQRVEQLKSLAVLSR